MAQTKINKHGYQMNNLREICSMTKGMIPNSTYHIEIAYDRKTGNIAAEEHIGTVGNNWCTWTEEMIPCGYLTEPKTQQQIADQIANQIEQHMKI